MCSSQSIAMRAKSVRAGEGGVYTGREKALVERSMSVVCSERSWIKDNKIKESKIKQSKIKDPHGRQAVARPRSRRTDGGRLLGVG